MRKLLTLVLAVVLSGTAPTAALAQVNVAMYGPNGTIGHGAIRVSTGTFSGTYGTYYNAQPILTPFMNSSGVGGRYATHPVGGLAVAYSRITGAGAFEFVPDGTFHGALPRGTGVFSAPGTHLPTAAHSGTLPSTVNLPNGTVIPAGTQILSDFAGLEMDYNNAADYWMSTGPNIEHRVYRNGTWGFYYDQGGGSFVQFAGYTNVTVQMTVNWGTGVVDANWSGTPTAVNGILLPATGTASSSDPVDSDGILNNEMVSPIEGLYGRFPGGLTFSFDVQGATHVPEPGSLALLLAAVCALAPSLRRRRGARRRA